VRGREELLEMANRRIPLTQVQVAELLGVSRNVVHRVEQDAQAKIKEALEEQPE
jgi:DNA-directed RNA polymerase specialized sigma subunit